MLHHILTESNITIQDIEVLTHPDESEIGSPSHVEVINYSVYLGNINITSALTKEQQVEIEELIIDKYE